ncbi:ABC di/oligopeptide transporter ATPase [Spirochaetia bacterium]|nr:ABC di/oligopeptide transporter ATPase [Spirochaetia bacterium]
MINTSVTNTSITDTPVLTIRNLSNSYTTRVNGLFGKKQLKPVLDNINLDIAPGEIFGIVGESGCGKTTLGRSVLGLIDYTGDISIDGLQQSVIQHRKHRKRDLQQRREMALKVQTVFQDPSSSLNPVKRALWLLEEPLKIHGIGNKAQRQTKVDAMLDMIGLDPSYKNRRVSELSGGQKQRICIGAALMLNPRLIVADEPISSLDVSVGAQILNLFRDLHERLHMALLFISHNLDVVYYLCSRIAVMYQGQIVELGEAETIYSSPAHPYTRSLLEAIPHIGDTEPFAPQNRLASQSGIASQGLVTASGCRFAPRCAYKQPLCTGTLPELVDTGGDTPHLVRCAMHGT